MPDPKPEPHPEPDTTIAHAGVHRNVEGVPGQFPTLQSDAGHIRQVLGNMIANAIKHTPGPGRISVRANMGAARERPGEWLAVEVQNSGPTIPADRLENIFEEFVQLEPGDKPGVGLGLPISRQVARALGGELIAASDTEHGTTFTLLLPMEPPGPRQEQQA